MARKLTPQALKSAITLTHEGAAAYDLRADQPLLHLCFTFGSALFTDGFYTREAAQVRAFAEALGRAHAVEPRFPWQYAAWMRDPVRGKGNRIQGSLAPALLDGLLRETPFTEDYVATCLGHRPDDVAAFVLHLQQLRLGRPTAAARRGMARALAGFDAYQLLKYARPKDDVRLCDAIAMVRPELEALGEAGALALRVGRYLHAPTRDRSALAETVPLLAARRHLFTAPTTFAAEAAFVDTVRAARVTWEQVLGRYGVSLKDKKGGALAKARKRNGAVWKALLADEALLPDMALLRNLRNLHDAGVARGELTARVSRRRFDGVWPHQVYAGAKAVPTLLSVFEAAFRRTVDRLPPGRHLGLADASGSMAVRVGGPMSSMRSMDVALCLTALMSETSGLGASFSDDQFKAWTGGDYLRIAQRSTGEGPLAFAQNPALRTGMGGTQVHGAVLELVRWLTTHRSVKPPECLWFFSDMQFHPAKGSRSLPRWVADAGLARYCDPTRPPLEQALQVYRAVVGPVDVVLWNLAAYGQAPVPLSTPGVLMVSGFDANTLSTVGRWRAGATASEAPLVANQAHVLDTVRAF